MGENRRERVGWHEMEGKTDGEGEMEGWEERDGETGREGNGGCDEGKTERATEGSRKGRGHTGVWERGATGNMNTFHSASELLHLPTGRHVPSGVETVLE